MTAIALPAAPDRYRFKYLIAITVSLASVLELLDTSIVNVAIPHMNDASVNSAIEPAK